MYGQCSRTFVLKIWKVEWLSFQFPCERIFEICSYWGLIFTTFCPNFEQLFQSFAQKEKGPRFAMTYFKIIATFIICYCIIYTNGQILKDVLLFKKLGTWRYLIGSHSRFCQNMRSKSVTNWTKRNLPEVDRWQIEKHA